MSQTNEIKADLVALRADLTPKEALFADHYLGAAFYNATKAAALAGYAGTANTLGSVGFKLIRKPEVAAYVQARLDEVMSSSEVLHRIAATARTTIDDVLADNTEHGLWFDERKARSNGAIHQVKKFKFKRKVEETKTTIEEIPAGGSTTSAMNHEHDDEDQAVLEQVTRKELVFEEIEFEMYSHYEATRDMAKFHKLLTDRMDANLNLDQADVQIYIPDNGREKA